jgi:hypothetical protein
MHKQTWRIEMPAFRFLRLALLVGTTNLALGCASTVLSGGRLVDHDLSHSSTADYRIESCASLPDNEEVDHPKGVTLHVLGNASSGQQLFERLEDGTGMLITNRWSAADGTHFFVRVKATAWEYILPQDPSALALRMVYVDVETTGEGDAERPRSAPLARCRVISLRGPQSTPIAAASPASAQPVAQREAAPTLPPSNDSPADPTSASSPIAAPVVSEPNSSYPAPPPAPRPQAVERPPQSSDEETADGEQWPVKVGAGFNALVGGFVGLGLHLEIADMGPISLQIGAVGGVDWASYSRERKYVGGTSTVYLDLLRSTRARLRVFGIVMPLKAYEKSDAAAASSGRSPSSMTVGFGGGLGFASGRPHHRYSFSVGYQKLDYISAVLILASETFF